MEKFRSLSHRYAGEPFTSSPYFTTNESEGDFVNNPLPAKKAKEYAHKLMNALEQFNCLDFESESEISTEPLFEPGGGQMFGILACTDDKGNEIVLKAFSGQYNGRWLISGWVPPVCSPHHFNVVAARNDAAIHLLTDKVSQAAGKEKQELQEKRKALSQESLKTMNELYHFRCIDGSVKSISDTFGSSLPPTGTGECCAPKLLHHAFHYNLHPVSMTEFYFGAPNKSGSKTHKEFYGPCDNRCRPLLKAMLGLDIIYSDEQIVVVNKPSGLLSVPGRVVKECAEARVKQLFPDSISQPAVHRLDMDTSGLILFALTKDAHRHLSKQFINKQVGKTYTALLEGVIKEESGTIELPFRLDVENRPYQIYDPVQGNMGVTQWKKLSVEYFLKNRPATRIEFTPLTGRTHQLRVHSAHIKGLGHPIIGDRLYGNAEEGQRLLLHADMLSFLHPVSHERLSFSCPSEF